MEEKEDVRTLLDDEIRSQFEKLDYYEPGSKEYSEAINGLTKIYQLKIDQDTSDWDANEKEERRLADVEMQQKQLDLDKEQRANQIAEQKKDRIVKLALEGGGLILSLRFLSTWMSRGFEFEKDGTYTSQTFKWLFGRFKLPWK